MTERSAAPRIRPATPDDAAFLATLGARCFRDTFGPDNDPTDMALYLSSAFDEAIQRQELEDASNTFLFAEVDGVVAGYSQVRHGDAPEFIGGEYPIEIVRMYADAPWIGRGIGSALMAASIALVAEQGGDMAWLAVWEQNARAIAFYEKWGFAVAGRQTFQLGTDLQHDLVLARATDADTTR
jgi:diamine N-acetyltransferase